MRTYRQLYLGCRRRLAAAGIEDPGTDAALLCRHFFSLDRPGLAVHGEEECPLPARQAFLQAVEERAARRPLQYILGRWGFMGLSLQVGEGVLVPREDTAVLVEALARLLAGKPAPVGIDLCAGTGAVALGLCSLAPGAAMTCVEVSPQAMGYLEKNLGAYPQYRVKALQGDVLDPSLAAGFPGGLDCIASNPPYIARGQLPALQPEVRQEPALALDGGPDGLLFYRAVVKYWAPLLGPGGVLGVEIGEEQGAAVRDLFRQAGLVGIAVHKDWAGLDRAVTAAQPPAGKAGGTGFPMRFP